MPRQPLLNNDDVKIVRMYPLAGPDRPCGAPDGDAIFYYRLAWHHAAECNFVT